MKMEVRQISWFLIYSILLLVQLRETVAADEDAPDEMEEALPEPAEEVQCRRPGCPGRRRPGVMNQIQKGFQSVYGGMHSIIFPPPPPPPGPSAEEVLNMLLPILVEFIIERNKEPEPLGGGAFGSSLATGIGALAELAGKIPFKKELREKK